MHGYMESYFVYNFCRIKASKNNEGNVSKFICTDANSAQVINSASRGLILNFKKSKMIFRKTISSIMGAIITALIDIIIKVEVPHCCTNSCTICCGRSVLNSFFVITETDFVTAPIVGRRSSSIRNGMKRYFHCQFFKFSFLEMDILVWVKYASVTNVTMNGNWEITID